MLTTLRKLVEEDVVDINAAKLRIFSRINPPQNLLEDETYFVNQDAFEFLVKYADKVAYRSSLQIIGTWSHSHATFLWPWHNDSIAKKNYLEIQEKMSAIDELKDILGETKLTGEDDYFFFQLCNWIALKCGYQGVYPASYDDNVTVYLAVNLEPVDRDDRGRTCVMCMCKEYQTKYFVASSEEFGICSRCIENLMDVVAPDEAAGESLNEVIERKCKSTGNAPAIIPCQLCQTAKPDVEVIAGPYTGICFHCIKLVAGIHQEKSDT